jgi:hypothetical protein
MENLIKSQPRLTHIIRWTARILSVVSIGLVLLFIVGEGFNPTLIKPAEWIGLLFFPVGISIGMILAWWQEGIGGSITVGSLAMFYIIHFATAGKFPNGWAWLVFTIPGFLFLLCWYRTRKVHNVAA